MYCVRRHPVICVDLFLLSLHGPSKDKWSSL
jgi:hypothetical protein